MARNTANTPSFVGSSRGNVESVKNGPDFDLFRLSKSKIVVDISPNTLRAYHKDGLPFYTRGRAVFVSKMDLINFIRFERN